MRSSFSKLQSHFFQLSTKIANFKKNFLGKNQKQIGRTHQIKKKKLDFILNGYFEKNQKLMSPKWGTWYITG